eukprot:TRINITY_DN2513_c0_g1_i2.p1 TRINITY_DN2513_c0_g1~~TRINITY_DN2513_c0_g1_i2.p1  ORF type:complete len:1294 (-),score=265.96 TRINITY_DN2513_c0_g1_i2:269-4150(-)
MRAALLLLLCAILTCITCSNAADPVARILVSTVSDSFQTNIPVLVDGSRSSDADLDRLMFLFDFDDGTLGEWTFTKQMSHVYTKAGTYAVTLFVSDTNSTNNLTQAGSPVPFQTSYITLTLNSACYQYALVNPLAPASATNSLILPSSSTLLLYLQVVNLADATSAQTLSRQFYRLGEAPSLTFSNLTVQQTSSLVFNSAVGAWTANFTTSQYPDAVTAVITGQRVSALGCSVATTVIDVSIRKLTQTFASSISTAVATPLGAAVYGSNTTIGEAVVRQDPCLPNSAVMLFRSPQVLRDFLVQTEDLFGTASSFQNFSSASCDGVSCANIELYDVVLLQSSVMLLTSRGVLLASSLSTSPMVFRNVSTGVPEIDTGLATSSLLSFMSADVCPIASSASLQQAVLLVTGSASVVMSVNVNRNDWTSLTVPSTLINATDRIWAALQHPLTKNTLFLIANASTGTGARIVTRSASGLYAAGFTFPASAVVTGLYLTRDYSTVLAYGSEVYQSGTGEYYFEFLFTCDAGETIMNVQSSAQRNQFVMKTSLNRILYGRFAAQGLVELSLNLVSSLTALTHVLFDGVGALQLLELDSVTGYPASAAYYPLGLLASPSGILRGFSSTSSSLIARTRLPVDFSSMYARYSFDYTIVPSYYIGAVSLYASKIAAQSVDGLSGTASSGFTRNHIGLSLRTADGGVITITDVDSVANTATGRVSNAISLEGDSVHAATTYKLTVSGSSTAVGTPLVLSVALNISNASGGWKACDVGKTVFLNLGSAVITSWLNESAVSGTVFSALSSLAPAQAWAWGVLDLRGAADRACVGRQNLRVVGPYSDPTLTVVTVDAGTFTFQDSDTLRVLSLLNATAGVGVIRKVLNGTHVLVAPRSALTVGTYTPGQWTLQLQRAGTLVYSAARSWSLRLPDCLISFFASNISVSDPDQLVTRNTFGSKNSVIYLDQRANFSTSAYVTPNYLKLYGLFGNAGLVRFDTSLSQISSAMNVGFSSLTITGTGQTLSGESKVFLFPRDMALTCTNASAVSVHLFSGCPPTTRIIFVVQGLTQEQLFLRTATTATTVLTQSLAVNYRPPSAIGRAIPTSDNIYNADYFLPRYFDRYNVSRATGAFKQCFNKTHATCACTTTQRYSQLVANSDCLDTTIAVQSADPYVPTFLLQQDNRADQSLQLTYTLTELNGRQDYCFNATASGQAIDCSNWTQIATAVLDPTAYNALIFKGVELFHFRVTVAGGTYCLLQTEFMVSAIDPPLAGILGWTVASLTGVSCALIFFLMYLVHCWTTTLTYG